MSYDKWPMAMVYPNGLAMRMQGQFAYVKTLLCVTYLASILRNWKFEWLSPSPTN